MFEIFVVPLQLLLKAYVLLCKRIIMSHSIAVFNKLQYCDFLQKKVSVDQETIRKTKKS